MTRLDFIFGEVVFGDEDVLLSDLGPFPGEEAEVFVSGISAGGDDFGSGVLGDREEEEILDGGEEGLRALVGFVVVCAEGKKVADLLVKAFFRGTNVTDAGEHLIKVVWPAIWVLETFVVHDKAFEEVVAENGGGPTTELNAAR